MKYFTLFSFLFCFTQIFSQQTFNFQKALHFPSTGDSYGMVCPMTSGSFYAFGLFCDTMDFDPGPGESKLVSKSIHDPFIARYNADGQLKWLHQLEGSNSSNWRILDAISDADDNLFLVGTFQGTYDLDPGPEYAYISSYGSTSDGWDGFIVKYDPQGVFLWGFSVGSQCTNCDYLPQETFSAIELDADGNIIVAGQFMDKIDIENGNGASMLGSKGMSDIYMAKYNTDGELMAYTSFGSTGDEYIGGMTIGPDGKIILTGGFSENIDFDLLTPGGNMYSTGGTDYFMAKFDSNFNNLWSISGGNENDDMLYNVAVDNDGNIFTSTAYNGTIDFDPGPGDLSFTSIDLVDVAILKYSPLGALIWAHGFEGLGFDLATVAFLDEFGNPVYNLCFEINQQLDLDPGPGQYDIYGNGTLSVMGRYDAQSGHLVDAYGYANSMMATFLMNNVSFKAGNAFMCLQMNGTGDVDPTNGVNMLTSANAISKDLIIVIVGPEAALLPVDFVGFTANPNARGVKLDWWTANEINNAGYEVLRSTDGTNWLEIGRVSALNNPGDDGFEYSYFDNAPHVGANYYQLRQRDLDGKFSFSPVRQVYFDNDTHGGFTFYPNPVSAQDDLMVSNPGTDANMSVSLYSQQGQLVRVYNFSSNQAAMNLHGIPPGQYIISTVVDGQSVNKRLVVN